MAIKYHYDVEQNTDLWFQAKLGVISASNINKLVTPTGAVAKNDAARKYAYSLAAQRVLKRVEDSYQSFDMLRGTIQEAYARDIYNDNIEEVKECGFITNDNYGFTIGSSPDGLVGLNGGLEIKSRLAKFQIETILSGEVPKEFVNQCQFFLLVSGREWIDFVSYSTGLPFFVKRVTVDQVRREKIVDAMMLFEETIELARIEYLEKSSGMIPTEWIDFNLNDEIEASD